MSGALKALDARGIVVKYSASEHRRGQEQYRLIPGFHEEYAKCFSPPYPTQTTVVAGLAREQMVLEIEAIAVLGAAQNAVFLTGPAL